MQKSSVGAGLSGCRIAVMTARRSALQMWELACLRWRPASLHLL